jgi:hypothetical protein
MTVWAAAVLKALFPNVGVLVARGILQAANPIAVHTASQSLSQKPQNFLFIMWKRVHE